MSRKSLIICLSVLAGMVLCVAVGVALLYSGAGEKRAYAQVPDNGQYLLMPAIPTDALVVGCFSSPADVLPKVLSESGFAPAAMSALDASGLKAERAAVSLHYVGKVVPLYVFDAGNSSSASAVASVIGEAADAKGLYSEIFDCSAVETERKIGGHTLVLVSPSKDVVKSSVRHLNAGESVIRIEDFARAASEASGNELLFVANRSAGNIISSSMSRKYGRYADFVRRLADWMVFDLSASDDAKTSFVGRLVSDSDEPDLMSVFEDCGASVSELSQMLPSYTVSAMTLPLKNRTRFIASYQNFLDSKQGLQRKLILRNRLTDSTGIAPEDFCERLEVTEVATAAFVVDGKLRRVNLMKLGSVDESLIFAGTGVQSLKNYSPSVHPYQYESYLASVFGDLFYFEDETFFTYIDGWIVSGGEAAVKEYAAGRALSYNLKEYMANADLADMFADSPAQFKAYLSLTEDRDVLSGIFGKGVCQSLQDMCAGADYSGAVLTFGRNADNASVSVEVFRNEIKRSKAPVAERNTEIEVSRGPFKVKNSGTGRINNFYQRKDNNYLCLQEENGKGIWGVPFSSPICGTAHTIDFYANKKLQILFGSGSRLYLIDRLGRFVNDCSVDLGKEILLGPDVYDFSGKCKYNVMVLHKDNTIEMYNLQGKRPDSWTTITAPETIMGLPERIEVGGKTFWVVRTSIQTLIYPFGGGAPVSSFEDDKKILPTSNVRVLDASSVEVESYDGKKRTLKLR